MKTYEVEKIIKLKLEKICNYSGNFILINCN